ncbi:hypothetical protein [Aliiroseovarius sp. 2305UL8-7]|uniref:hypothetical protein n=1 Tax=Aliiroseovarius conchicola TaxID=3121637 RepID=UPI003528B1FD
MKQIAAIVTVRNGGFFLQKWIDFYGRQFGEKNLFVTLDGVDQDVPPAPNVNYITTPHRPLPRLQGDKLRAAYLSAQARILFMKGYDVVVATDIDEYIVVDPQIGHSLAEYLSSISGTDSLSSLGLDVVQNLDHEDGLIVDEPWLKQRNFAQITARYTKPNIIFTPLNWGSGMHRIKGKNFQIDPNLYMIHTGMIDAKAAKLIGSADDRVSQGWSAHQSRREQVFQRIRCERAYDGDMLFPRVRRTMSLFRPIYAWNKPGHPTRNSIIRLPQRFEEAL